MCLYPRLIKNPKYKATKKNGGVIPHMVDDRVMYVPIGCNNCIECRKQKAREWQVRLQEDLKENKKAHFITLTLKTEAIIELTEKINQECEKNRTEKPVGYDLDNAIATKALRLFLERWRKQYKKSIRHWISTELGHNGTENVHMHGIIWTEEPLTQIEKHWQYGYVWKGKEDQNGKVINYVNEKTVNYIVKYVSKIDEKHPNYKSIILTSAGIGNRYTKASYGDWEKNKYNEKDTNEAYKTKQGNKLSLPIYYRNKIYKEEEREKLWLNKLDKQERYILGQKISIANGDEEYNKALKAAQERNKELGYGNNEKDWNREQYEREQRILKQKQRIAKHKKTKNTR